MIRHHLPVYSPLSAADLWSAAVGGAARGGTASGALTNELLRRFRAEAAVLADSGTAALQLALRAAARETGSPVVALPAYCCYDIATAAVGARARVLLYDVDPRTLAPDLDSLEEALRGGARTVVAAPLYGLPFDWEALETLASAHGAMLIEDAAQGHGAAWRGEAVGSLGRLSVLSFGRGKGWTGGGGGAVLFRRGTQPVAEDAPGPDGADARALVTALMAWLLGRPSLYGIPRAIPWLKLGVTVYHPPREPGRMADAAASLLLRTGSPSDVEAEHRRAIARYYISELAAVDGVELISPHPLARPGFLRFPVRLRRPGAAVVSQRPGQRLGIMPGYPTSLSRLEPLSGLLLEPSRRFAGAEELARSVVTLPTHSLLTIGDRRRIVRLVAGSTARAVGHARTAEHPPAIVSTQPSSCEVP